ncbi:unnamed protein product, partial [Iphiclides podalirius]
MVAIFCALLCAALAAAEHSGAYSSPQYAKKMYPKRNYDASAFLPREKPSLAFNKEESIDRYDGSGNDTSPYGRSSFLGSAGNLLSNAGGQVMSSLANDFLARSTGSSQEAELSGGQSTTSICRRDYLATVNPLSSTRGNADQSEAAANPIHLVMRLSCPTPSNPIRRGLSPPQSGQQTPNKLFLTEDEILLYLSYLTGQHSKDYGCLYRLSCQRPHQASLYSSGAELMLQGAKLWQGNSIELTEYENITSGIKQASVWGEEGKPCKQLYKCE